MTHLPIIFRREYVERVRSRSFLLSTVLTPLFFSLVALGPALSERLMSGGSYHVAVIDESETVGPQVVETINDAAGDEATRVTAEGGLGPAAGEREELADRLGRSEIDGYLWIPAGVATTNQAELRVDAEVPLFVRSEIVDAVSNAVRLARLREAGVPDDRVAVLFRPVDVAVTELAGETRDEEETDAGIAVSFMMGFLLYFLILLYGSQVLHSVQEEKTSRIAEVLVSSVHPGELMLGKVLGVGATALTQVAVWAIFVRFALGADALLARTGLPVDAMASLGEGLRPGMVLTALAYLLLGFFLYATLFATVGAAAASMEDAQRFTFPIIIPLMVPMLLGSAIVNAPRGTAAVVMSWIPLTAPVVMTMRIGGGAATPLEIGASLVMLVLSVLGAGWVAGKIYRVGILSTGSRPSLRDLWRWVRMA